MKPAHLHVDREYYGNEKNFPQNFYKNNINVNLILLIIRSRSLLNDTQSVCQVLIAILADDANESFTLMKIIMFRFDRVDSFYSVILRSIMRCH